MLKKIALENISGSPGLIDYWTPTAAELDRNKADILFRRVTISRASAFRNDAAGSSVPCSALPAPACRSESIVAPRRARQVFQRLSRPRNPGAAALLGFGHLAMQDPESAANELERCVKELQFCGAMINGHTRGVYLDERVYDCSGARRSARSPDLHSPLRSGPARAGAGGLRCCAVPPGNGLRGPAPTCCG